ncbi:MAG TPA: hypothetical protein VMH81_21655 [Bryobacteraceae bacterium]|nr:hypothetical protein [Bryobacteraceae bacterium]
MPIILLFCSGMGGMKYLLSDCDTGWHIRTGEWILANHRVPVGDVFSFSKPGQPWFAWEWLADVIWAWMNAHGGLRTVVLFTLCIFAFTFALLFRLLRRKSNPFVAVAVTMITSSAATIHWLARPHLFTLFFLVVFYGVLERVRDGKTHLGSIPYLAILPAITIFWTNLHGGFFVGIMLIGIYGVGELLSEWLRGTSTADSRRASLRKAGQYFLSAFACLVLSLINPYTWHLHEHIIKYLGDPYNSQHIFEFQSPSFHNLTSRFFEIMLVLAALAVWRSLAKGSFTEPLLLAPWVHASFLAGRNIPIFAILAAFPAAAVVQEGLEHLPEWNVAKWLRVFVKHLVRVGDETAENDSIGRLHLVSALGVALLVALIFAPNPPKKFRAEFDPSVYPQAALATLRTDPNSKIFTHDEWGDYLIWSLYPSHKVFVDGRSDFYGDDFEYKYIDILNVHEGWEKYLTQFGVDTILMPPDAPLTGALKESSHWRKVYDDGVALVFCQTQKPGANSLLSLSTGGEVSRDREVTKTKTSDQ